ncbi:Myosin regulatory light chain 12B [Apodemus speciosus]|uniref:Myosin regulatory light chain 12B n=1 Tax=Apodemus speciosus TaxID=105296 RepID=A0ABQ0FPW0_APOSI
MGFEPPPCRAKKRRPRPPRSALSAQRPMSSPCLTIPDPRVQRGLQHDRPEPGRLHRQGGPARHAGFSGEEPHRRLPGRHDERGPGPHQFHHVPHHVWREAEWHRPPRTSSETPSLASMRKPQRTIQEDYLRELLTTMGDRFTDEEVDELYREGPH